MCNYKKVLTDLDSKRSAISYFSAVFDFAIV